MKNANRKQIKHLLYRLSFTKHDVSSFSDEDKQILLRYFVIKKRNNKRPYYSGFDKYIRITD